MIITLTLDPARLWRWHVTLAEVLAAKPGVRVHVAYARESEPLPRGLMLALQLERLIAGRRELHAFDRVAPLDFIRWSQPTGQPDVIVDLAARAPKGTARTLTPLYDGTPGETAFWNALLDRRAPALAIHDSGGGGFDAGLPAIERPHALRNSAAGIVTRLITGLERAVHATPGHLPAARTFAASEFRLADAATTLVASRLAGKAQRALNDMLKSAPKWAVAWRQRPIPFDPLDTAPLDPASFNRLPDDGRRYYADPFLFAQSDAIDVFVEELPYATGRGHISMFSLRPDGTASPPRPVLEAAHHLSYPQVFARDGEIWMLPEASATGALTLYRAARYPDRWEPAARLIDEPLHDATLFEHNGRLWIAAATQGPSNARWGSSWDSLSLYSATRLLGPWTPHPKNPVLTDARSARPAGDVFTAGGQLFRPAQDCSTVYGGALAIAHVTRLTADDFAQTVVSKPAFAPKSGLLGPHTLNRLAASGAVTEVIDLFAKPALLAKTGAARQRNRTV